MTGSWPLAPERPGELKGDRGCGLGGATYAGRPARGIRPSVCCSTLPRPRFLRADAAHVALGILLRVLFLRQLQDEEEGWRGRQEGPSKPARFSILCADPAGAKIARFEELEGVGDGVLLARELVNEPANIPRTIEFADKAAELEKLGVKIEILTERR